MTKPTPKPKYPEHEKLTTIREQSNLLGEFLEWANRQGMTLCTSVDSEYRSDENHYIRSHKSIETLLAGFFDVDLGKLEKEKVDMLKVIRSKQ